MSVIEYDLIVIGAGGGANIVKSARRKGLSVAVVERERIGGTCLNRGCIPSKMLIHAADVAEEIHNAKKFDLIVDRKFEVRFGKLTGRITDTVFGESDHLAKIYRNSFENLDWYKSKAEFVSDKVIKVGSKKITAKKIVIAVGARPNIPPIPGLKDTPYWTSTDALRAERQPKKLVVIGGGYIAVELGCAYSNLGTDVHFLSRGPFVSREDKDVIDEFTRVFEKKYKISKLRTIVSVEYKNKEFIIKHTDEDGKTRTVKGDNLLVATGVKPNGDLLKLENTKIKTNRFGFICVNEYMETGVKGVYAIGDCVGNYLFRHSVNFETDYLVSVLIDKSEKKPIKYPPMPHAIFSSPQVAGVGYTEQDLIEKKIPYVVGLNKYEDSAMGQAFLSDYGFVKLLFHKKTQKLIGAHIIGPQASTMIHQMIYAMTFNAKLDDMLYMIYVHPALPEIVRNACRKAKVQFDK